jgi:hypothetical protein
MKLTRIALNFYVGAKASLLNKQAVMILKHKITEAINSETQRLHDSE